MVETSILAIGQLFVLVQKKKGGGTDAKQKIKSLLFWVEKEHVSTLHSFFNEYRYCWERIERDTVLWEDAEALAKVLKLDATEDWMNDMTDVCFVIYLVYMSNVIYS